MKANDDYGMNAFDLHYSVNGGPDQTVNLLKQKGVKQADGSTVLSLENFKLVPGDVVSVYATAKDARSDARTDITFIQAEPFEREFTQSQASGWRWRRWRRRSAAGSERHLPARKGNHRRHMEAAGR